MTLKTIFYIEDNKDGKIKKVDTNNLISIFSDYKETYGGGYVLNRRIIDSYKIGYFTQYYMTKDKSRYFKVSVMNRGEPCLHEISEIEITKYLLEIAEKGSNVSPGYVGGVSKREEAKQGLRLMGIYDIEEIK